MNQLWETTHEQYVTDVLTAARVYSDICDAAAKKDTYYEVAFVGRIPGNQGGYMVTGDCIGHSFFEWFDESTLGVTGRVQNFMFMLGYEVHYSNITYSEAAALAQGRPSWPAEGSVFWAKDDPLIIKLSD